MTELTRAQCWGKRAQTEREQGPHADCKRPHACECDVGPHRPLDELDAGLQVQAEVDEIPLDALALVLLLLQDEHGVVEELLQLLVGVVDAQLLEGVHLSTGQRGRPHEHHG